MQTVICSRMRYQAWAQSRWCLWRYLREECQSCLSYPPPVMISEIPLGESYAKISDLV